jgi:hypothetical protein
MVRRTIAVFPADRAPIFLEMTSNRQHHNEQAQTPEAVAVMEHLHTQVQKKAKME